MDDCVIAEEEVQLWKTVAERGWKRCRCGRVIERDEGCDHMTSVFLELQCLLDIPNLLPYRCESCKAQWCYGCGVAWPRNSEPTHALDCGNQNQELDPESDDERDEQDNLVDRPEPDFDHSEHDISAAEQDPDGNFENGGPCGENRTQANPEAEQETDPILVQENQPPQVVQHKYSRLTPDQRNCLHRNPWFHRSRSSTCQICH